MTTQERRRLERELATLPTGSIVRRMIRGTERFYHQWRENGSTRSRYLKADEVAPLRALVERRKEIKRLLAGIAAEAVSSKTPPFRTDVATGRALLELAKGVERFDKRDMFPSIMKYLRSDVADRVLVPEEKLSGAERPSQADILVHVVRAEKSRMFPEWDERRVQSEGAIIEFVALGKPESKRIRAGKDDFHAHSRKDVGQYGRRVDEVLHERDFVDEHIAEPCVVKDFEIGLECGHGVALRGLPSCEITPECCLAVHFQSLFHIFHRFQFEGIIPPKR